MAQCADFRLGLIETAQNADGGWGYFPGKESWLEPTVYALLALAGEPHARPAMGRATRLLRSWELGSGGVARLRAREGSALGHVAGGHIAHHAGH